MLGEKGTTFKSYGKQLFSAHSTERYTLSRENVVSAWIEANREFYNFDDKIVIQAEQEARSKSNQTYLNELLARKMVGSHPPHGKQTQVKLPDSHYNSVRRFTYNSWLSRLREENAGKDLCRSDINVAFNWCADIETVEGETEDCQRVSPLATTRRTILE